jgi:hypothetical protein
MCGQCDEIDKKIAHYRTIVSRVTDKFAQEGISELIAELLAKKAELHPDGNEYDRLS